MPGRTEERIELEIVRRYKAGESAPFIARALRLSGPGVCYTVLGRYHVQRRDASTVAQVYAFNKHYFDNIDDEHKAYLLGFLAADGSLYRNLVAIRIQERDRHLLEQFKRDLESEHPITLIEPKETMIQDRLVKAGPQVKFVIGNRYLGERLRELGIHPNKTQTIRPCTAIPPELLPAYWRGVVDGDGGLSETSHISTDGTRFPVFVIQLLGSCYIVDGFIAFLEEQGIRSRAKRYPYHGVFQIRYGGIALPKLISRILYQGATVGLERKIALAHKLWETPVRRPQWPRIATPALLARLSISA